MLKYSGAGLSFVILLSSINLFPVRTVQKKVIYFISISEKFGICTVVVGLNGKLVEAKIVKSSHLGYLKMHSLASTSVSFRPMTVKMSNLLLMEMKRVTM